MAVVILRSLPFAMAASKFACGVRHWGELVLLTCTCFRLLQARRWDHDPNVRSGDPCPEDALCGTAWMQIPVAQ
ncbi:hypothetical protein ACP70R_047840 [Stipagrostis hirtigluma subsp. patula]